ncbi:MAG: MFS transporter, partial [Dialister sp.]|nr:MFS transporter [Dialister sp.]
MVVGFSTSFALMGNVAGPMASGAIAMQWGYGMVFWSTAFCFFLAACVIYREKKII